MSWALVAGIGLLIVLVLGRTRLNRWIYAEWAAGRMTDRRAKVLMTLITFGPHLVAAVWIAAILRLPWGLLFLAAIILALVPAIGMGTAMLDYQAKYVLKRQPNTDDDQVTG